MMGLNLNKRFQNNCILSINDKGIHVNDNVN